MERTIPKNKSRRDPSADLRVRRSKEGLREALLGLLNESTFEEITVRQIADRAQVGYTTFFRHYASKEALIDTVIMVEIRHLTGRALPIYDAADAPGACEALCAYVNEHRRLWTVLLTGGAAPKVREEMLKQSRIMTETRNATSAIPPDLGAALGVAVILELLSWWLRQPTPWSVARIGEIMHERIIIPSSHEPGSRKVSGH